MAYTQIKKFRMGYKLPQQVGEIQIQLVNNSVVPFNNLNPAEFTAIGKILDNSPVFYDSSTGWLSTSEEAPQD